jgi:hypothetical protein
VSCSCPGLSFFHDIGKGIKSAAQRAQDSIERNYAELAGALSGAGRDLATTGGLAAAPAGLSSGHRVPLSTEWDDPGLMMMILPVSSAVMAMRVYGDPLVKAPGTTLLVAANCFAFSRQVPVRHWCLLPHMVVTHGETRRLLTASFIHLDVTQLLANMSSLIISGLQLERGRGWRFIAEVLGVTLAANVLRLASMAVRAACSGIPLRSLPHSTSVLGGLGFSASCLALRVVSLHQALPSSRQQSAARLLSEMLLPGQLRQMSCWAWYGWSVVLELNAHAPPKLVQVPLSLPLVSLPLPPPVCSFTLACSHASLPLARARCHPLLTPTRSS